MQCLAFKFYSRMSHGGSGGPGFDSYHHIFYNSIEPVVTICLDATHSENETIVITEPLLKLPRA